MQTGRQSSYIRYKNFLNFYSVVIIFQRAISAFPFVMKPNKSSPQMAIDEHSE